MDFIREGLNVCILGPSDSGKSYLAKALGIQAFLNYRAMYHHYEKFLETMVALKQADYSKYQKKVRFYLKLDLLILDDFLLHTITDECEIKVLFEVMEKRSELSTNLESLSQPIMKIGYWLYFFFNFSSSLTIVLGRIKFDCTLEDLHPVCQRKCFAFEHSILSHPLWIARVAKSVLSRANLLPILW